MRFKLDHSANLNGTPAREGRHHAPFPGALELLLLKDHAFAPARRKQARPCQPNKPGERWTKRKQARGSPPATP